MNQKFKVILNYLESSRTCWTTGDLVWKRDWGREREGVTKRDLKVTNCKWTPAKWWNRDESRVLKRSNAAEYTLLVSSGSNDVRLNDALCMDKQDQREESEWVVDRNVAVGILSKEWPGRGLDWNLLDGGTVLDHKSASRGHEMDWGVQTILEVPVILQCLKTFAKQKLKVHLIWIWKVF